MTDTKMPDLTPAQKAKKKVEELQKKLEQAKAAAQKLEAAASKREKSEKRRIEDRQKFLLGAFLLEQMQKSGLEPAALTYNEIKFSDWLTRSTDRVIFGLVSIDESKK